MSDLMANQIDRSHPLRDQIYELIRGLILRGELEPGAAVEEKAIASRLNVSRTPVREAVKKLSDEGLVVVAAQSGTFVSWISRHSIEQAFVIRRALELESVSYAAQRITPNHLAHLEDIDPLHGAAIARKSYAEAITRDDAFHHAICEISEMPMLWRAINISKAQLDRCRHLAIPRAGAAEATLKQHRAILTALASGDAEASRAAMGRHLDHAYRMILAYLEQQLARDEDSAKPTERSRRGAPRIEAVTGAARRPGGP